MMFFARLTVALLLLPSLARAAAAGAPATNWVLPIFTDKEGYRSLTARGSEVRQVEKDIITVTDLSITVFSGDAASRVETILLSPLASFHPKTNRAGGDKFVRVVRDDLEATGTSWTYDHARKHVTLEGDVRIVFNAEVKDLLK
ncbi:MAG: hypothetical protein RIQ93_2181 [Verrucomicrobiota bacterium]|jgi:hypothetical protein